MPPRSRNRCDDVVLVRQHVLLMALEHDQVVRSCELVAVRDVVEVRVGDELRLLARPVEPVEERQVVAVEARRHAACDVGASEIDGAIRRAGVPRVAVAVTVHVLEVVGLPCVRRQHDEHATRHAEQRRAHDERRVSDAPVRCCELHVVEAAREVRHLEVDRVRLVAPRRPVEHGRSFVHLDPGELVVGIRDDLLRAGMEHAQRQRAARRSRCGSCARSPGR